MKIKFIKDYTFESDGKTKKIAKSETLVCSPEFGEPIVKEGYAIDLNKPEKKNKK